jgi:hypothetical protein
LAKHWSIERNHWSMKNNLIGGWIPLLENINLLCESSHRDTATHAT